MHKQSVRLFLYSSFAILLLTFVWGFKQVPTIAELERKQIKNSLEQELSLLNSTVRATTTALKFRLLDVLKAEGNDHPTRAFQDSPFTAAALLEWKDNGWRMLWHSTKMKAEFDAETLRQAMGSWPLATIQPEATFFTRIKDVQGQSYFVVVAPVRKLNQAQMLGVGVFAANQFGLSFSSDRTREARVFTNDGTALALSHPAYLGSNLKREPLVREILDGDVVSLHQEWKGDHNEPLFGVASRVGESNLYAAVQTELPTHKGWMIKAISQLAIAALVAMLLNWFLFAQLIKPLLQQLEQSEGLVEKMRRQLSEAPAQPVASVPLIEPEIPLTGRDLPQLDFVESKATPSGPTASIPAEPEAKPIVTPLGKVVQLALRLFDRQMKEQKISVDRIGLEGIELEGDVLQLQTAFEEIIKNAIEALTTIDGAKHLSISAHVQNGRATLSFENNGPAIHTDHLKKVFDPFFTTKEGGSSRGLGLNVVRRVLEELHGSVRVHNVITGQGVLVEVEWPLTATAQAVALEAPLATVASASTQKTAVEQAMDILERAAELPQTANPAEAYAKAAATTQALRTSQPMIKGAIDSDLDLIQEDDADDFAMSLADQLNLQLGLAKKPGTPSVRKPKVRNLNVED